MLRRTIGHKAYLCNATLLSWNGSKVEFFGAPKARFR